jgi:hypothetical protein
LLSRDVQQILDKTVIAYGSIFGMFFGYTLLGQTRFFPTLPLNPFAIRQLSLVRLDLVGLINTLSLRRSGPEKFFAQKLAVWIDLAVLGVGFLIISFKWNFWLTRVEIEEWWILMSWTGPSSTRQYGTIPVSTLNSLQCRPRCRRTSTSTSLTSRPRLARIMEDLPFSASSSCLLSRLSLRQAPSVVHRLARSFGTYDTDWAKLSERRCK